MPAIAWVLIAIFALALIPGLSSKVESTLKGVTGAATAGPVNTVLIAWGIGAVAAAGLSVIVWKITSGESKKQGTGAITPTVAPITVAAPPTFGGTGGLSASTREGVGITQGVKAGSGRRKHAGGSVVTARLKHR
jgi:hypothetical protein